MRVGVVESGGNLSTIFEKYLHSKVQQVVVKKKKARDLFDALAFLKHFEDQDHRVLIVQLKREEDQKDEAFFEALANLEATTGKPIFKCIYYDDENAEVSILETADKMIDYLFKPKMGIEEEEFAPGAEETEWLMPGEETGLGEEESEGF